MKDIEIKLNKIQVYLTKTNNALTEKERFFSSLIKLSEEVGELCEAALKEKNKTA